MGGDLLGMFEGAAVLQVSGDAGGPEGVIAQPGRLLTSPVFGTVSLELSGTMDRPSRASNAIMRAAGWL